MTVMGPTPEGHDWVGLSDEALPVEAALAWAVRSDCGAQVLFTGMVRDHAEGRSGVSSLEYEAYVEQATPRLSAIAEEARRRWPLLGPLVMLHRIGRLAVGDIAVIVVVTAPHRGDAFEAAEWAIDTIKASVPIWKQETWSGGVDWGTGAQDLADVGDPQKTVRSAP
jgi:molybdopterin synthase catalytic subunit